MANSICHTDPIDHPISVATGLRAVRGNAALLQVNISGPPLPLQPLRSTMLKVLGVLIKLSYRGHVIGLMSWYDRRVETPHPE